MKLVLRKEIQVPKKLIIGDPLYFERGYAGELTCVWNRLSFIKEATAEISVFEETFEQFRTYVVRLYVMPKPAMEQLYNEEKDNDGFIYFPAMISGKMIELGCDTARFTIETDKGFAEIRTGGDGFYGNAIKYKNRFGIQVELNFDADVGKLDDLLSVF